MVDSINEQQEEELLPATVEPPPLPPKTYFNVAIEYAKKIVAFVLEKSSNPSSRELAKLCEVVQSDTYNAILRPMMTEQSSLMNLIRRYATPQYLTKVSLLEGSCLKTFLSCIDMLANMDSEVTVSPNENETEAFESMSDDAELSVSLGRLLEEVSGAVRVIIRFNEQVPERDDVLGINRTQQDSRLTNFTLESDEGEPRHYGPFFNVSTGDTRTNEDFAVNILEVDRIIDMLTTQKSNVCMFTYGYSGSGKTYTLYGKSFDADLDNIQDMESGPSKEDGCIMHILYGLKKRGCGVVVENVRALYGYMKVKALMNGQEAPKDFTFHHEFKNDDIIQDTKSGMDIQTVDLGTFWKDMLSQMKRATNDVDVGAKPHNAFIKSTINNPRSSRGFLIISLLVTLSDGTNTTLCIVDMAGNEDPFDLLLSMAPLNYIPSAAMTESQKKKKRIPLKCDKRTNYLVSDDIWFVNAVFNNMFCIAEKNIAEVLESAKATLQACYESTRGTKGEANAKKVKESVKKLFLPSNIDVSGELSDDIIMVFKEAVRVTCMFTLFVRLKEITESSVSKESEKIAVEALQNVDALLEALQVPKGNRDDIVYLYGENDTKRKQPTLKSLLQSMDYKSTSMQDRMMLAVDKINETSKLFKTFFRLSMRYERHTAIRAGKMSVTLDLNFEHFHIVCQAFAKGSGGNGADDENYYARLREALKSKDSNLATSIALQHYSQSDDIKITFDEFPESGFYRPLIQLASDMTSMSNTKNAITSKFLDNPRISQWNGSLPEDKDVDIYTDNMRFSFGGDDTNAMLPSVLYRILHEAYYINQANLEMKGFLVRKKEDSTFNAISSDLQCSTPIEELYVEKYDTFESRFCNDKDEGSATNLTPTFVEMVDKGDRPCKYIMIANIRKEKDQKFRTGAIDTLTLMQFLKT